LTRHRLRRAVAAGAIRRVARGVYVDHAVPDSIGLRAAAIGLLVPDGVAIARGTAAWLYGVAPVEPDYRTDTPPLELLAPSAKTAVRRRGVRGSSARLLDEDLCLVGEVLATTPARTLLDLARSRDRWHALAYADALLRTGLVGQADLLGGLDRLAGHPWVLQAREIVGLADARAESAGESWLRLRWFDAGFPPPTPQLWVCEGETRYRLDLAREEEQVGGEYDGEEFHGPDAVASDQWRRDWFAARGWRVVGFRVGHVLGPSRVFETVMGDLLCVEPRFLSIEARHRTRPWLLRAG
jgi:hypothetical protein